MDPSLINNLNEDPCQMTLKEKLKFFEGKETKKKIISNLNIFPKKAEPSSDNKLTPSPQATNSSNGYPKKSSTSTTDNNAGSSAPNTSSSIENMKNTTPTSQNSSSSGMGILNLDPSRQSTTKKESRVHFKKSHEEIINDGEFVIPEILEVFTDLDLFIDKELDEINVRKRLELNENTKLVNHDEHSDVFMKLKEEYLKDKQQYQKEFEKQLKHYQRKENMTIDTIIEEQEDEEEEEEEESSEDVTINTQMDRWRLKKLEKLSLEVVKQENLMTKINRVLECVTEVNKRNLVSIINIERHYLVASNRFQSALTEIRRLSDPTLIPHPRPFHIKGNCVLSEVILEIRASYFERQRKFHNEFIIVMLKYEGEVYGSKAICISDDIRTIKFPHKFFISEVFMDFEMRLEVYGTTFWRKQNLIRSTMLKKYGFTTFTLADTGEKQKRFEMVQVIKSENSPIRKKILMKIHQKITADVHLDGILFVKLGDSWHKTYAQLCGHLMNISLLDDHTDPMLLDLHNFDSDFIIPVFSSVSQMSFSFLLKFNHYIDCSDFYLMVAAETADDYSTWVSAINKVLVLIKR